MCTCANTYYIDMVIINNKTKIIMHRHTHIYVHVLRFHETGNNNNNSNNK